MHAIPHRLSPALESLYPGGRRSSPPSPPSSQCHTRSDIMNSSNDSPSHPPPPTPHVPISEYSLDHMHCAGMYSWLHCCCTMPSWVCTLNGTLGSKPCLPTSIPCCTGPLPNWLSCSWEAQPQSWTSCHRQAFAVADVHCSCLPAHLARTSP